MSFEVIRPEFLKAKKKHEKSTDMIPDSDAPGLIMITTDAINYNPDSPMYIGKHQCSYICTIKGVSIAIVLYEINRKIGPL